MSYSEDLKNPLWQKKRLEILQRDNFSCQLCSDEFTHLHIHHKYYKGKTSPWEYPNDALVTYCKHCHAAVEYIKKENKNLSPLVAAKRNSLKNDGSIFLIAIFKNEIANNKDLILLEINTDKVGYAISLSESTIKAATDLITLSKNL